MGNLRWLTRNWADTDEPGDPSLTPVDLSFPLSDALDHIKGIVRGLPLWRLESVDPQAGTLTATRTTRFGRFVDDITIRLETTPTGTRVHARSKSRIGFADFGQNRRNLLELLTPLRQD